MPLPSQSARSASIGRATMYRRKRSNLKPFAGLAVVVLVLAGSVYGVVKYVGGGPGEAGATPVVSVKTPEQPQEPAAAAPGKVLATDTTLRAKPPEEPPLVELHQGRGQPTDAGGVKQAGSTGSPMPAAAQPVLGHPPGAPAETPKPPAPTPAPAPAVVTPPMAPTMSGPSIAAPADLMPTVAAARQKQSAGDLVAARALYSRVLADGRVTEADRGLLRAELTRINDDLVFSPRVAKDDPFVETYSVQSGDNLTRIAQKLALGPDRRLLKRINKLVDEHRLNVGQKLKVIKAPFHAVVNKSAFRLDLYLGPSDKQDQWVYVRSFKVGLGESGSTPLGTFIAKKGSKLVDPPWINPRTGEKFDGNDPKNPIGKFWIGLEGLGEASQYMGYGIHGTIDPGSVGFERSMGCVRMLPDDIAMMYELMGEQVSVVKIVQ